MAQNLVINGVTYNSVNSLSIPKSAGGNACFPYIGRERHDKGDILQLEQNRLCEWVSKDNGYGDW